MINSMYIISLKSSILLEKHCKHVTNKSVCQQFLDVDKEIRGKDNICSIMESNKYTLIHSRENDVYFLAIVEKEVSPLFVMEFLRRVIQVLEYYFNSVSETVIEDNLIKIYEILDEMLDNGFPLITECNILAELIRPPNVLRQIADQVNRQSTTVSSTLPVGQLSIVPWRKADVKYPSNEAYFDFFETIDALIDKNGSVISCDVVGTIKANIHLSGIPDLTMSFNNPKLIDDIALHSCIRFFKWEKDRILSFIPPDGQFDLCTYYVQSNSNINLPVNIKSLSKIDENRSYLDITVVGNRVNAKKSVDNLCLTIHLPKAACNIIPKTCSVGKTKFNTIENTLSWHIGKLEQCAVATLKGPIVLQNNSVIDESTSIEVTAEFKIEQCTISGINVNKVEIFGEKYSPYKGVKYVTSAGKYQLRA